MPITDLWDRLIKADIIETYDDVEGPEKDESGNDVYLLNTKDGYTVEIIVNDKGHVEIGDIGKGNLPPVIRRIETSTTKASITAKAIVSRLKDGTVEYYYKLSTADDSTYTKVTNVTENGITVSTGITEGETYTVKAVAKNENGESVLTKDIVAIDTILVESITLDKQNGTVTGGLSYTEDLQLTAIIKPDNATNKEVEWISSNNEIATVDSNGKVTAGSKGGNVTITAKTKDGSSLTATCEVIVEIFGRVNTTNTSYTDSNYEGENSTITIPGGYAVGTSENVSKIENGLVIQDNNGNQFVWVPVDNPSEMFEVVNGKNVGILYNFSGTTSTRKPAYTANSDYREPDVAKQNDNTASNYTNAGITGITNATEFKVQLQREFDSMKASVEKYKGFYIGRYETGDLSKMQTVVKRNNTDITNQTWYVQYQKSKTIASGSSATSTMIWGCQWDACMRWFQKSTDGEVKKFPTDSTGKGNYKGTQIGGNKEIPTGSNNNYKVNNIYDMGGNVYEWTLEAYYTTSRINRRRLL